MLAIDMIQWWYTKGWKNFATNFMNKLRDAMDFFSIRLLVTNMFAPFRQISANTNSGPSFGAQISAFFDRLFSRFIGMVVRLLLLIIGIIILALQAVLGLIIIVLWPLAPVLCVGCLVLAIVGVTF